MSIFSETVNWNGLNRTPAPRSISVPECIIWFRNLPRRSKVAGVAVKPPVILPASVDREIIPPHSIDNAQQRNALSDIERHCWAVADSARRRLALPAKWRYYHEQRTTRIQRTGKIVAVGISRDGVSGQREVRADTIGTGREIPADQHGSHDEIEEYCKGILRSAPKGRSVDVGLNDRVLTVTHTTSLKTSYHRTKKPPSRSSTSYRSCKCPRWTAWG